MHGMRLIAWLSGCALLFIWCNLLCVVNCLKLESNKVTFP